jgi:hypothetical protein
VKRVGIVRCYNVEITDHGMENGICGERI